MGRNKAVSVLCPVGWVVMFFLWGMLFSGLFPDWNGATVSIAANLVTIATCFPMVRSLTRRRTAIGFEHKALLPTLGRCVFVIACWFCSNILGNIMALNSMDDNLKNYLTSQTEDIRAFAILSIVVAPVAEELLFRGLVYQCFRSKSGVALGACLSSLLFGAAHGTVPHLLIGLFFGTALCFLFEYSGQIFWCIIVHMFVNALSFALSIYGVSIELFISVPIILFLALCAGLFALILYPCEPVKPIDM